MQQRGVLGDDRDLRAQRFLRDAGDVLAVDQDAAFLDVEEAQQQVDRRRLAGAGAADQADLLARLHGEVEAVEHRISALPVAGHDLAAVAETQVLEHDLATRDLELRRLRRVGEPDRLRDRHHAFLHDADVLEDVGHLPGDPARDVDDLPGQRQRHRDGADFDLADRPQVDREPGGAGHHHRVERRQRQAEQRVEPQRGVEHAGVLVDRVAHIGVLLARAGEQLHRQDVGVAVDHAPGQHRAHLGHVLRAVAHARHEDAQHHQIGGEPDQDRQREPAVGGGEQDHRARCRRRGRTRRPSAARPASRGSPGRSA